MADNKTKPVDAKPEWSLTVSEREYVREGFPFDTKESVPLCTIEGELDGRRFTAFDEGCNGLRSEDRGDSVMVELEYPDRRSKFWRPKPTDGIWGRISDETGRFFRRTKNIAVELGERRFYRLLHNRTPEEKHPDNYHQQKILEDGTIENYVPAVPVETNRGEYEHRDIRFDVEKYTLEYESRRPCRDGDTTIYRDYTSLPGEIIYDCDSNITAATYTYNDELYGNVETTIRSVEPGGRKEMRWAESAQRFLAERFEDPDVKPERILHPPTKTQMAIKYPETFKYVSDAVEMDQGGVPWFLMAAMTTKMRPLIEFRANGGEWVQVLADGSGNPTGKGYIRTTNDPQEWGDFRRITPEDNEMYSQITDEFSNRALAMKYQSGMQLGNFVMHEKLNDVPPSDPWMAFKDFRPDGQRTYSYVFTYHHEYGMESEMYELDITHVGQKNVILEPGSGPFAGARLYCRVGANDNTREGGYFAPGALYAMAVAEEKRMYAERNEGVAMNINDGDNTKEGM